MLLNRRGFLDGINVRINHDTKESASRNGVLLQPLAVKSLLSINERGQITTPRTPDFLISI